MQDVEFVMASNRNDTVVKANGGFTYKTCDRGKKIIHKEFC